MSLGFSYLQKVLISWHIQIKIFYFKNGLCLTGIINLCGNMYYLLWAKTRKDQGRFVKQLENEDNINPSASHNLMDPNGTLIFSHSYSPIHHGASYIFALYSA